MLLNVAVVAALAGEPPLSGPALAPRVERATLVSYDMQNRLRAVETTAEHEAVGLLQLEGPAREAAERVLAARAARVDAFVAEHLFEFGQLDTAGKAGAKLDAAILLGRLMEAGWGLMTERPVREQVAEALPAPEAERFRGLIGEWRRAWWKQAYADARGKGERPPVWAVALAERGAELGQELGKSYERQASMGTLIADYLLAAVALTEEQRRMVSERKLEMLRRTRFRPTEKDQGLLVLGILAHLPAGEREKVIDRIPR
jgi:hypothetical protein